MSGPTHWATLRVLARKRLRHLHSPGARLLRSHPLFIAGDSRRARGGWPTPTWWPSRLDRYDAIVVKSRRLRAMMKEYGLHWRDGLQPHRQKFAAKVKDVNEFLDGARRGSAVGRIEAVATYHDACHLGHAQASRPPRGRLLAKIPGLELRNLPETGSAAARPAPTTSAKWTCRTACPAEDREHFEPPARRSYWPATPAACCKSNAKSGSVNFRCG